MKRVLAFCLVVIMVFSTFSGCGSCSSKTNQSSVEQGAVSENGSISITPVANGSDETSEQVITEDGTATQDEVYIPAPERLPVGTWDIPVPEINPYGAQSSYEQTDYEREGHQIYYKEQQTEYRQDLKGEIWNLYSSDTSETTLASLRTYAKEMGATVMDTQYEDRLLFQYSKDGFLWWGDAAKSESGYLLSVVKQIEVQPGESVTLNAADADESGQLSFVTRNTGEKYQTLIIEMQSGIIMLTAEAGLYSVMREEYVYYSKDIDAIKTDTFLLDDMPQGEGVLNWTIYPEADSGVSDIKVSLAESVVIPQVTKGDAMGALRVINAPLGNVVVEPVKSSSYYYDEDFNYEPDETYEGDSLFWLPSGYWNVYIRNDAGFNESLTRMVPVNSGELTQVTFPDSMAATANALNQIYASAENLTGGILITDTVEKNGKGIISLKVEDPLKRDVYPTAENTIIQESGVKVDIVDITRDIVAPSIILVLDSSGSMTDAMDATLAAAKEFIKGLPDGSYIKVIDFDTEVKVLDGETKEQAVKALSSIAAKGYTVLFDATMEALDLLDGKERPALVVFSDGADSNTIPEDIAAGKGSMYTKEDVIYEAKESGIPVYTIGFGGKLDETALKGLANASDGQYYPAKDTLALKKVFGAINSKFGNAFTITYNRPTEADNADTPVIAMVLDNSGSMDLDPAEEGCDYRIDEVKELFHDFVLKLPEECLLQLLTFTTDMGGAPIINLEQATTTDKYGILQGIGEMYADLGTPILDAVRMTYENLKAIPSNNKVMVFLTDAALEVPEEEQELFKELLVKIKEDGITVLWAGLGVEEAKAAFASAADLSGGKYVISEDPVILNATLEEILAKIKTVKPADKLPLSITISDIAATGEKLTYFANTNVKFTAPAKSGKVMEPEHVEITTGTRISKYDSEGSALLYGASIPTEETILTQKLEFDVNKSNDAMKLSVKKAYLFAMYESLRPSGEQFLALDLELINTLAEKIEYQIPSINSHFYVCVNNEGMYPASSATWLTETPLSVPGEYCVSVMPGSNKAGALMFLIPDVPLTQLSLHFYDTVYGHIVVPLVGTPDAKLLEVDDLPKEATANITDSFSMAVSGVTDVTNLDIYTAPSKTSFRVVEAKLNSKVNALLDINPMERLWMKTETATGPLMVRMSGVTEVTPLGFAKAAMLAPGSDNKIRLVYPIATVLSKADSVIYGDFALGELSLKVANGGVYGTKNSQAYTTGDGIKVRINQLTTLEGIDGYGKDWVVADVTFSDIKDEWGTGITSDFFELVLEGYEEETTESGYSDYVTGSVGLGDLGNIAAESTDMVRFMEYKTSQLLYGVYENFEVYDGAERRGFVLFTIPDNGEGSWTLQSPYIKELKVALKKDKFTNAALLTDALTFNTENDEFDVMLEKAVSQAIYDYQSIKQATGDVGITETLKLDDEAVTKGNNIPVPYLTYYGAKVIQEVKTEQDALTVLQGLSCIPTDSSMVQYSPEAVITQGWGSQWDLANLTKALLSKAGYTPSNRALKLTEDGKQKLNELCKADDYDAYSVPGVAYVDEQGTGKLFVIPFMKMSNELMQEIDYTSSPDYFEFYEPAATIKVYAKVSLDEATASQLIGDMGAALGGGEETGGYYDYIELLTKDIPMTELSKDAIEIGYMKAGFGQGLRYMAAISSLGGIEPGTGMIDTGKLDVVGIKIEIATPFDTVVHETTINEGEELDKYVHTLSVNLPDLSKEAADALESAFTTEYKAAVNPNSFSVLKWYSRNIINRFINSQSAFDRDIGEELGLTLGRVRKARCIMVTSHIAADNTMRTTIDLIQAENETHNGDTNTIYGYNLGSGFFLSSLEGSALTGDDKVDYLSLWAAAPEDTSLIFVMNDSTLREQAKAMLLEKGGYPDQMMETVMNTEKVIITTDKPILYQGEERFAWLEIDPYTYQAISVFDTGEHAGMAEYTMSLMPSGEDGGKYMLGAFIGIDVAVWSVASCSLELSDYKQILAKAADMAKAIGEHLDAVMSGLDSPDLFSGEGGIGTTLGEDAPVNINIKVKWSLDLEFEGAQNLVGFQQGFEDALSVYFTWAKQAVKK